MLEDRLQYWRHAAPAMPPLRRRGLPGAWCEQLLLGDGRQLLLRPIRASDAEPMRAGFTLLTPEEVRLRFLHPLRELTPEAAARLARPQPRREWALVVAEDLPPGEGLVGAVVRAAVDDDGRAAEFAIIVSRYLRGLGLGRYLMKRLIRWARLKRLRSLHGDVLDDNQPMLQLAASLGFRREHRSDEPGITQVSLDLGAKTAPVVRSGAGAVG